MARPSIPTLPAQAPPNPSLPGKGQFGVGSAGIGQTGLGQTSVGPAGVGQVGVSQGCAAGGGRFRVTGVGQGDVLNIRSGPGTETPILFFIPPDGGGIERLACPGDGRWCRVRYQCREGWALARLLTEDRAAAADSNTIMRGSTSGGGYRVAEVAAGDTLKVRQSPTGDSLETGSLPPGTGGIEVMRCIDVPDYAFQWCLIRHRSLYGWVYGKHLARD